MSIVKDFLLPDLGEGLTESEIVSWRVAVGETVVLNQIIAEVETAKALVELPSPFDGVIAQLYADEGATVQVGDPIVAFEIDGSPVVGEDSPSRDASVEREPVLVGYGPKREGPARPQRRGRRWAESESDTVPAAPPESPPAAASAERETRVPIAGVRKATAAAMVASAFTAPHATEFLTVDATAAMELIGSLRASTTFAGHRVTLLSLVAKAVVIATARTPEINSRWDEEAQEIVRFNFVNLGIAAATSRGLLVPVIDDADRLDLAALADAIAALADEARSGRTPPSTLAGGTISITNVGVFGVDAGTPILNPGEAAILAIGAVRRLPWECNGEIALRQILTLSLSFDHRLVDGEQASRFLVDVGTMLSEPGMALAMV